jgi:uncharacterized protein YhaN
MRLRGWHVDGFGLLHDFHVADLTDGLTVILGPNEAGKTSLLAFIRGVLFGFPDGRKRERQYPPLRGGRHGGRLFIETDGLAWTIERYASPAHLGVTRSDGSLGSEADLRHLVGGVDAELYRNVFAFSLAELQVFETLQVEGVKDRIFAAGVVGAGRSARAAIQAFADRRSKLGRKRGACQINDLRDRVGELDGTLDQARARAARHPELRRAAEDADAEQKRIGGELASTRREIQSLDALLQAWPDWFERVQAETDLVGFPDAAELPDDLATRLDTALAEERLHRGRREDKHEAVLELDHQLVQLIPSAELAAVAVETRRLATMSVSIRARREKLRDIENRRDALRKRVDEEAPRLGPGWTSAHVRAFDTSIPAAQEIADWGEKLRGADQVVQDAERRARDTATDVRRLAGEVERRIAALERAPQLPDAEVLVSRDGIVRKLRAQLGELAVLRADLRAVRQRVADADRHAKEVNNAFVAKEAEVEEHASFLMAAPLLPSSDDLSAREQALRELRTRLADLVSLQNELRAAMLRVEEAEQRTQDAADTVASQEAEIDRRSSALREAHPLPDSASLSTGERVTRDLRTRLSELALTRAEVRNAEVRLADRRDTSARRASSPAPSVPKILLLVTAAMFLVVAVVFALVSQYAAAAVAVATGVIIAMLAFRSWDARAPASDDAAARIADAERDVVTAIQRLQEVDVVALAMASTLGFSSLPDALQLEGKADEIAGHIRAWQDRDRETAAIDRLRTEAAQARGKAQRTESAAITARRELESTYAARVQAAETAALVPARALGFTNSPNQSEVEGKTAEVAQLVRKRQDLDRENSALESARGEVSRTREGVERARQAADELRAEADSTYAVRVSDAERAVATLAEELGLASLPTVLDLEAKADEVAAAIRQRRERDSEVAAIGTLKSETAQAQRIARAEEDAATEARVANGKIRAAWSAWKIERQCPEGLRPETAQQFFVTVQQLRESLAQIDTSTAEIDGIEGETEAFKIDVQKTISDSRRPAPLDTMLPEDAIGLALDMVDADTRLRDQRARVSQDLESARANLVTAERELNTAKDVLKAVFAEAGASDDATCRAAIAMSRRHAEIAKRAKEADHRLRSRLGTGAHADSVRTELASGDLPGWESRKQACRTRLSELQPTYEEALRHHQTVLGAVAALERETDVVALATERESIIAEIREAIAEWRLLAIAESLVQGTLRRYEVERQPAVLTRAAESFSRVTEGRYTRLVAREEDLDVLGADGGRIDAAALSRGTAEQLYLCLRLALASEFGRLSVPLPLVMDDVLVNFDPERARLAATVLIETAADHQALLFTCHPETVDMLIGLGAGVRIIEIPRQLAAARLTASLGTGRDPNGGAAEAANFTRAFSLRDEDLAADVLTSIRTAGRPLSRADILAATGLPEPRWTSVIQSLRNGGLVVSHGRKRGTTWGLPEWGSPPDDEE